ncbi:MAG TPA: LCP family protein [Firmicutes bacterium]|nr:LCP family protein [Bacillota bacterium]
MAQNNGSHIRRKKKMKKGKKAVLILLIAILCVLALLLIAGGIYIKVMLGRIGRINPNDGNISYVDSIAPDPLEPDFSGVIVDDPVHINDAVDSVNSIEIQGNTKVISNILLVGVETDVGTRDDVNNYSGRSDSMIILSIDRYHKTIKMISLLRDSYVAIPGHGYGKLNSSYRYGGFELLAQTIEQNFRIKIDQYIAVNFKAFTIAVGAMDGVDIVLTDAEIDQFRKNNQKVPVKTNDEGLCHLDAEQALYYSRIRAIGDDWGRTARQRTVLQALMSKAKSAGIGTLHNVLYEVLPYVSTNMSENEILGYVGSAPTYLSYEVDQMMLPDRDEWYKVYVKGIGSCLGLKDPTETVLGLHHFIYG